MNIETSDELRDRLVRDAYTSVGLLQELTKATLDAAGIHRRSWRARRLDDATALTAGRARVVQQISSRFDPFLQLFPQATIEGVRPSIYPSLIRLVTARLSESDLLAGVKIRDLHSKLLLEDIDLELADVRSAVESLDAAQRSVNIKPTVLAYDAARQRLILADRRMLLYLRERPPE